MTDPLLQPSQLITGHAEVSTIMTKTLTTVTPDHAVSNISHLFDHVTFHHLPVVEAGVLIGIISDRDLAKCLSNQEGSEDLCARDIMSSDPVTVDPSTSIETASILLLENRFSCLPVINDDSHLEGILSWKDLLRFYVYHASTT